ELGRIAPQSPYVMVMLQKLSAIRRQEELSKNQIAQAKAKFDEGVAFFNQKNYTAAIDSLQASFSINPGSFETADYLKRAQEEQAKDEAAKAAAKGKSATAARTATGTPA